MSNDTNKQAYDQSAQSRAKEYNSMKTPDIMPIFCKVAQGYPEKSKMKALDLGCGTGRDARWLAEQGFDVTAVDNSNGMLEEARKENSHENIRYVLDEAPSLSALSGSGEKFDVILMSAFLFHLNEDDRQEFYKNLEPLMNEDSYVYMTLREGPIPEGREMYHVPVEEVRDFAERIGAQFIDYGQTPDALNRPGVAFPHLGVYRQPSF